MILVIDTSVLIDHLRGEPAATKVLRDAASGSHQLWSATPVRTEVLAGMRSEEEAGTHALLDALSWQAVTIEVADLAGQFARRYLKSHSGVDTIDYLVAATTRLLRGQLLTTNVRHFPMFPALKPAYLARR